MSILAELFDFIHSTTWADIPADVQHMAARCVLDLCATLVAGNATNLSRMVRTVAVAQYGGDEVSLLLDGRCVSAAGAVLANGMTIDAMDMHDGYRLAKGHAGVNVMPAALAGAEIAGWDGQTFMAALVVGYEIALRAGQALHETACDYHTSGAWGALGAASVMARALGLTADQTRHAFGIAEYHGPRSQMMRCIDHPTMLKDGSGWGSMAGVVAATLAAEGFTGAPALTVEGEEVAHLWATLGDQWLMRDLYFKPYACCRWAQPAIEATLSLVHEADIALDEIGRVEVHTFEAAAHLTIAHPADSEQAQYSLPYPVAAALVAGQVGPSEVLPPKLFDEDILQIADRVKMIVDPDLEARFPAEALARVTLHRADGSTLTSEICGARGDPSDPLTDAELDAKFTQLTSPALRNERREALREVCWGFASLPDAHRLVDLLAPPPDKGSHGEGGSGHADRS